MPFGPERGADQGIARPGTCGSTPTPNGDGVADKRELFDTGFGRLGNVEHEESFLTWGLDNWMYSTVNAFRARWTPHGVIKEPTGSNGAQWGVVQDDDGKMWFQGGASGLPAYWQFPILYGNFGGGRGGVDDGSGPGHHLGRAGPDRRHAGRPERDAHARRLAAEHDRRGAGGDVVRGHRMPPDLQGDYFYGEVVAPHRAPGAAGEERGPDADPQLLRRQRVHQVDRSALPAGRS